MTHSPTILIVDDAQHELFLLAGHLEEWGYTPLSAIDGTEALDLLRSHTVDLIVSDQEMDGIDGIALLQQVKHNYPAIPFIMLTAHESASKAVAAMKQGADDYVPKPYVPDEFQAKIARILKYPRVFREGRSQQEELETIPAFRDMIAGASIMKTVLAFALKVVKSPNTTVLLSGEHGTGKGRLAQVIHRASGGSEKNFVHVSCAAIPSQLLESELFGHRKGAFTGADKNKAGKFDTARGGTILLDEIGDMSPKLQVKLLRALQERTYEPVGGNVKKDVECRVICAANQDLRSLVSTGKFREDLYYRINVFPITVPPLRERKEDIPLLVNHFIERFHDKVGHKTSGISTEALENLVHYNWRGNVRELENCMERAVLLAEEGRILPVHLTIPKFFQVRNDAAGIESEFSFDEKTVRLRFECDREQFSLNALTDHALRTALEVCDNNVVQAANLLNVNRKMFYRRKIV